MTMEEIPRNYLSAHTNRLLPGVGEKITVERDRVAVNLVSLAGEVAHEIDSSANVAAHALQKKETYK
jgi:hypothetical protein